MSDLRLGIIGAGYIARKHLEVINDIKGLTVVAITSRSIRKAKKLSRDFKIENVCNNYKHLFEKHNLNGVMILVSSENIFSVTKKIIPYKIPFFIEKPPGLTFSETKKLCNLCAKHKINNMVGFNRRFYSNFIKGIKIIQSYGKLLGVAIEGHERFWKIEKKLNKRNRNQWIYSNSSHVIDLFRFFAGEVKKIQSYSKNYINSRGDQFSSIIEFKKNILGNFLAHWYSPSGWSVKLYGDKVMVEFKPLEEGFWIDQNFRKHKIKINMRDKKYKPGFYNQMLAFKKMLLTDRIQWPAQSLNESLETMKLVKSISNEK